MWIMQTHLFWMFGGNPKRRLRKRATSCISESTIRPESFPGSFPLPEENHLVSHNFYNLTICRITHSPGWLGGSSTLQASGVEGGWTASLTGGPTNWVIAQFSRRQFVNHSSHVLFNQLSICLMNCSISRAILVKKCFKGC